ncbi:MAG: tRNA-queuosine alpha-mannosyltransferase domain-containing protein [Gammaproteobacteria bacterium]
MSNSAKPTGLIISPYHAHSHAIWAHEITELVEFVGWRQISLPPRFFSWRVRGNPLALLYEPQYAAALNNLDLLIVTSMTDLATLRGIKPALLNVPCIMYFHENQFAYPRNDAATNREHLEAKMVSLYGALSADYVVFNSTFNRETFLTGARQMLADFPDHAPQVCIDIIASKSSVIPVPTPRDLDSYITSEPTSLDGARTCKSLKVAWNHRWEYDKGPERLEKIIRLVVARNLNCQFFIFGHKFREVPAAFHDIEKKYPEHIIHMGHEKNNSLYYNSLAECDVVLSTALHDFQGLSILEGIKCGCIPLVPDRLAYREYIPGDFRYLSVPEDADQECEAAVDCLARLLSDFECGLPAPPALPKFERDVLRRSYRDLCLRLLVDSHWYLDGDSIGIS